MKTSLAALVFASLLVAACRGAEVSSPASAGTSRAPSAGASTLDSTAEPSPTPQPPNAARLLPFETARVVVDGLEVRQLPGASRPFVAGYRDYDDGSDELVTDQLRLERGYYVRIWAGPLLLDGTWWYGVHNLQQPGEDQYLRWEGSDSSLVEGWVAGAAGDDAYLVAEQMPQPSDPVPFTVGRYWALDGIGDATSTHLEFPAPDGGSSPVGVDWFAADPEGMDCAFTVTLEPDGFELASATVHDWGEGRGLGPQVAPLGEKWLSVDSDCSWALVGFAQQG